MKSKKVINGLRTIIGTAFILNPFMGLTNEVNTNMTNYNPNHLTSLNTTNERESEYGVIKASTAPNFNSKSNVFTKPEETPVVHKIIPYTAGGNPLDPKLTLNISLINSDGSYKMAKVKKQNMPDKSYFRQFNSTNMRQHLIK